MAKKRILIFTGKFLASGKDTDGGSILIYSLITALKDKCDLDVLFTRTFNPLFESIDGVKNVYFQTYLHHPENKFYRRLVNKDQIFARLKSMIPSYDKVIITHISKAFGIEELSESDKKKIALFPMFLSPSYIRSGEVVPEEYRKLENKVLTNVGRIYTPSESEKDDMVKEYGVYQGKIKVIPRGYSSLIKYNKHTISTKVNILYIASVKKQKNTLDAIKIIHSLAKKGFNPLLHIAGGIQDNELYQNCIEYIDTNGIKDRVVFHGILSQGDLAKLISKCEINISTSNWETYGRGIFEGMAGGLPTVLYSKIDCVKQYLTSGDGVTFVNTIGEFITELIKLIQDKDYYSRMSVLALNNVKQLSQEAEMEKFQHEFISKKVLIVIGTRPEAIKLIPVIEALKNEDVPYDVINTNQHSYLLDNTLEINGIIPDYKLDIFGKYKSLDETKNAILNQMNQLINVNEYGMLVVQGDTLSALSGAEFGYNHHIDVGHVEAGMRTFDFNKPYPEECYRVRITEMAKYFFCPSNIEKDNLEKDGIYSNVYVTGNTFVDYRLKDKRSVPTKNQVLVTIHRRENLPLLDKILQEIKEVSLAYKNLTFFFSTHPNPTIVNKTNEILSNVDNVRIVSPLLPDEFYEELLASIMVISDSGGVQEECILNGKKMIIVRSKTERKYDFENMLLVNPEVDSIVDSFTKLFDKIVEEKPCYYYGNGDSGIKIAKIIKEVL